MLFRRLIRILIWLAGFGVLCVAGLVIFLEVAHTRTIDLPAPTGPYAVGRVGYDWVDAGRDDPLAATPGAKRELMVWVWYPATPAAGSAPAPYLPPRWAAAREGDWGPGTLLFQRPASVRVHAVADAPLATDRPAYPVLLLLPGLGPLASDYTTLAEDLASHGYVVVAPTPTDSSSIVVFDDGRVARSTAAGQLPEAELPATEMKRLGDALIAVWADDARFVLDQFAALNADPQGRWGGRLDLARLGIFGHSFGGATAAEVCHLDRRCRAGANLDGYPYGTVTQAGLAQPFMFIWSEPPATCDAYCAQAARDTATIYNGLQHGGYQVTIMRSRHFNFTDFAVEFSPVLRAEGALGPIDGRRGLRITADYLRAFFDRYLNGTDSPLLHGLSPADYPEVRFASR